MKKIKKRELYAAALMLLAFAVWTLAVMYVDVQPIGPHGSRVGLALLNQAFHNLTGTHLLLYAVTDWLSLVTLPFMFGFALLGLVQWIRRRSICKVDRSILLLGGFYLVVLAAYLIFEVLAVNCRPVLLGGYLEVSYPSSTTVLMLCTMPTAAMQLRGRMKAEKGRAAAIAAINSYMALMVLGRIVSGVHWLSDIIGGMLLSASLVLFYAALAGDIPQEN